MQLLTPEAQIAIKINKKKYQWTDPLSEETIDDGHSLLNEVLKLMHPDVQTNVYAELAKIKSIKLVDHAFHIIKWHSAMEPSAFQSNTKSPGLIMNCNTSWIILMHLSPFKSRVLKPKLTSFATDNFVETLTDGMHHIFRGK
jgi:hypothetical protein